MGIIGLAWGTVIGALLHIAIQVPALRRYRFSLQTAAGDAHAWRAGDRSPHGSANCHPGDDPDSRISLLYVSPQRCRWAAHPAISMPMPLCNFPRHLFGTAIALVVFPTMAEQYNAGDLDGLRATASRSLRIIWFLTVPAAAGIVLLGRPVISASPARWAFTAESAQLVYGGPACISVLRVVSEATVEIAARLFYAQHNTNVPMFTISGWLVVDVTLAYLLIDNLGIIGPGACQHSRLHLSGRCSTGSE